MFTKGTIIRGPKWSEPVEVISFIEEQGIGYLAQVKGRKTMRFYEDYVFTEELDQFDVSDSAKAQLDSMTIADMLQYHLLKQDICYADQQARGNSNVMPLPHQIEAVYSRMMQSPNVRYLLADDPGAGKTIMSGVLISEMIARSSVHRILILVPPLVLSQWQEELKSKFGEDFTIVNRSLMNASSGNPFEQYDKILCSLYWGMRDEVKAFILSTEYDLVIVDEAHKMAAYTISSKKKHQTRRTKLYRLGESLAQKTEHLLLLTATPHKGDSENYRHLLCLLDEDLFNSHIQAGQIRDISKPYVIRRLKESMVQFDGAPLFPKRTTKTLAFDLSPAELELYEAVTEYVSQHFNRAKREGNKSTSFAMMILQRRLSSSIEAIYLSLVRRRERLQNLAIEEFKRLEREFVTADELSNAEAETFEDEMIGASSELDPYEIEVEIEQLDLLIHLTEKIRENNVEHKYDELEQTLFGSEGLIASGEKLLIFTESRDTLRYLERRLKEHVSDIALIEGSMKMEDRQRAVQKFRNEVPIMIATDAGGESINLQFCNQMINYDIPWNPNKLEQRMGRIHRIGQKNEVFVFNLVAINTREGQVMERLLTKLETMRTDLGSDLVYDFLGDVLESFDLSLDDLMVEAIENREHLDEVIAKMERILSAEHLELIELAKRESNADTVDLPGVRKTFNDLKLRALPQRAYSHFIKRELEKQRMTPTERVKNIFRISYLPKAVLQKAQKLGLQLSKKDDWVLTTDRKLAGTDVALVTAGHPLVKLLLSEAEEQRMTSKLNTYQVNLSTPIALDVVVFTYCLRDGNNRVIASELRIIGRQQTGEIVELSPHWLYSQDELSFTETIPLPDEVLIKAKQTAIHEQREVKRIRELKAYQKEQQLEIAFAARNDHLKKRLEEFIAEDEIQKNNANINKYNSMIREQEARRSQRIEKVRREGAISLQKIEPVIQLHVEADVTNWRLFPGTVKRTIEYHEEQENRIARIQPALGLIDFVSESEEEQRFIIIARELPTTFSHLEDYMDIMQDTYIYVVDGYLVSHMVRLADYL